MGQQNILRFEIAVYYVVTLEKHEAAKKLLSETSNQFERESAEVMTLDELVEIHP